MSRSGNGGPFMRAAAAVGDLASPFYQEERQRDVWNEASAVGFQTMLWLGTVAATVMIWVGRATALPYAVGTFLVVGAASLVTVRYAGRLGVEVEDPALLRRRATVLYLLLLGTFAAGLLASVDWDAGGFSGGLAAGAAVGGATGVLLVAVGLLRHRRRVGSQD